MGARISTVLLLALGTACSRGCHHEESPAPSRPPSAISVTDDQGHEALLQDGPARRIASLSPSNTELLYALGCGEKIVLRDRVSSYPPAVQRVPATDPFQLSPDHVAGFNPDLVLLSHADSARVKALRQLGLPVAVLVPRDLDGVLADVAIVGRLCGAASRARDLAARLRRRAEAVARRLRGRPRPSVFIETDGTDPLKPWTAGAASFVDGMLRLAGGRNVLDELKRAYAQVSAEEVLGRRPDFILVMGVTKGLRGSVRLRAREGWNALAAVREGRVIDDIDGDLLSRPGPRLLDGVEALARRLHPEAYR
jgi:iron complex transport system substrate-binding protein